MRILLVSGLALVLVIAVALWLSRQFDHRADQEAVRDLEATQVVDPPRFDPAMVADLPEPAQRYFRYTIADGTPLYTVATITMEGRFAMGDRDAPNYLPMTASQTLAAPTGFIWKMSAGRGLLSLSGSDSQRWTRFWLMGVLPVARMGGDADHSRSAFGRYVAEALFWTPAAVLPGPGIHWEPVDGNTARVTVRKGELSQAVNVTVAPDGRPTQVSFQRWSNANPDKAYRLQPFGGYLSDFRQFSGFRLPTRVEAGNFFGTEQYFPFFIVRVTDIAFHRD